MSVAEGLKVPHTARGHKSFLVDGFESSAPEARNALVFLTTFNATVPSPLETISLTDPPSCVTEEAINLAFIFALDIFYIYIFFFFISDPCGSEGW